MMKTKKKKLWLVILLSVIGVIVIGTAVVLLKSVSINTPTKGQVIGSYVDPKAALLVVDVQNDTTGNTAFYGDTANFVEQVNQTIALAQESGMEIVYIKNEYGNGPIIWLLSLGRYKKGTVGAELDSRLQVVNQNIYTKSIADSFSSKALEEYLISKEVDTLYIVGADASACIYGTARGGINRNYEVNVIQDAIITINDSVMEKMMKQYKEDGINVIDFPRFEEAVYE